MALFWKNLKVVPLKGKMVDVQRRAIRRTLRVVLDRSKLEVPKAERFLEQTGRYSEDDEPGTARGFVSYGRQVGKPVKGERTFYAIIVHERPARHDTGKTQYLRDPFEAIAPRLYPYEVREAMREEGLS